MLPEPLVTVLKRVPKTAWPMDVLRTVVSGLALFSPVNARGEHVSDVNAAIELIAKMPVILASWDRIRRDLEPIEPRTDLSHAANFLYMRTGQEPNAVEEDALDTYLVLLADHSFNASTFAARVTASTRADIYAATVTALATLEGDLHGGAASAAYNTLVEVGQPERAETYVRQVLARGEKIMGMGHREYKVRDPRARHLEKMAEKLSDFKGDRHWYAIARSLETRFCKKPSPTRRSTQTWTSTRHRYSPISACRAMSLPACSRAVVWPAGQATSSSNSRTIV